MPTGKLRKPKMAICQNPLCRRVFPKAHSQQKFCSARCRTQATNVRHGKTKGQKCRWCGEHMRFNFKEMSRQHCHKPRCEQKQWLWKLLKTYGRCKQCHSVTPRGRTEWRSVNYCPFCKPSRQDVRRRYAEWLWRLPRYVEALVPNPAVAIHRTKEYVKRYDTENVKFQVFCPVRDEAGK